MIMFSSQTSLETVANQSILLPNDEAGNVLMSFYKYQMVPRLHVVSNGGLRLGSFLAKLI